MDFFDVIYNNAHGYRDDLEELNNVVNQLITEKQKGEPLVSWFRQRNRQIAQVLDPMREKIEKKKSEETSRGEELSNALDKIKRAKSEIEDNEKEHAQQILSTDDNLNEIRLSTHTRQAIEQLDTKQKQVQKEHSSLHINDEYYNEVIKNCERVKELFSNTRHAVDINVTEFSNAIDSINRQKNRLDIDVPDLKQVPETYDSSLITSLHDKIREIVSVIDSRYPMGIYEKPKKVVRIIIHDVGNNRGHRAFKNRSNELISNTNESISLFNGKYWQITGIKYEGRKLIPRAVGASHSKIPNI